MEYIDKIFFANGLRLQTENRNSTYSGRQPVGIDCIFKQKDLFWVDIKLEDGILLFENKKLRIAADLICQRALH
jgi:hypothetical protein